MMPRLLFCLALLGSALVARASPLFEGSNPNLWLVNPQTGQVTSFSAGQWLANYLGQGGPVYPVSAPFQALVNELPNSSERMTTLQPSVSLIGLQAADFNLGDGSGPARLRVLPASGQFDGTVAVQMAVESDGIATGNQLRWRINGAAWSVRTLTAADQQHLVNGQLVERFFLIRDNTYDIDVELRDSSNQLLASQQRTLTLASTHPDGERRDTNADGLPDLVALAAGLDPLNDDWLAPSAADGWTLFDLWLRDATEAVPPPDSDHDGWSDIDELWRGTPAFDVDVVLPDVDPASAAGRQAILRYKAFPAARRLYEVEYVPSGHPVPTPDELTAASLSGDAGWRVDTLITQADLDLAGLSDSQIATLRLRAAADAALQAGELPRMRLPAGDGALLRGARLIPAEEGVARLIQLALLPRVADRTPLAFPPEAAGDWQTAAEWKAAFILWLRNHLVQSPVLTLSDEDSLPLLMLEQVLSMEARLRGAPAPVRLGDPRTPHTWLREFDAELATLNDTHRIEQVVDNLSHSDTLPQADTDFMVDVLASVPPGQDSTGWLDRRLLQSAAPDEAGCFISDSEFARLQADAQEWAAFMVECPQYYTESQLLAWNTADRARRYRLRLSLSAEARAHIAADATLLDGSADSDGDTLANMDEIDSRPWRLHTLPWQTDTDADGDIDSLDSCPRDPLDACLGTPRPPRVLLEDTLTVTRPGGQQVLLIALTLDRPASAPVMIEYQVLATDGDTGADGEHFQALSGSVHFAPGQQLMLVPVTLLGGAGDASFRLRLKDVQGADVLGPGYVIVHTVPPVDDGPRAQVLAEQLSVDERQPAMLDASPSTDPAGGTLSYAWTQLNGPAVVLGNASTALASFTAPVVLAETVLDFRVTVSTVGGQSDSAQVRVTVLPVDDAPVVTGTARFSVRQGDTLTLQDSQLLAYVSEPDGQPLSVGTPQQPAGATLEREATFMRVTPFLGEEQLSLNRSRDLRPFGEDGVVFLDMGASFGEPFTVYTWLPGAGVEARYSTPADVTITDLQGSAAQRLAYFDSTTFSVEGESETRLFMLRDGQPVSSLVVPMGTSVSTAVVDQSSGNFYGCPYTDRLLIIEAATQTLTQTDLFCDRYSSLRAQRTDSVCLMSASSLYCSAGNADPTLTLRWNVPDSLYLQNMWGFGDDVLVLGQALTGESVLWHLADNGTDTLLLTLPAGSSAHSAHLDAQGLMLAVATQDGPLQLYRWQAGAAQALPFGPAQLPSDSPRYQLGPLVRHNGDLYLHLDIALDSIDPEYGDIVRFGVFRVTPDTGVLQQVVTYLAGRYAAPGLMVSYRNELLLAQAAGEEGLCTLAAVQGDALVPRLDDINCYALLAQQKQLFFNRTPAGSFDPLFFRFDGVPATGTGVFTVPVSDDTGNTVQLPVELTIEEAP